MSERFDDLVGDVADPGERARLRRVHELLRSVDGPPEVPASLARPPAAEARVWSLPARRRLVPALIAAALALVAFGAGYLVGDRGDPVEPEAVILMEGIGATRGASASIELLPEDTAGNWPMNVLVRGLEPSRDRDDFYELWLTRNGELAESCGRFLLHERATVVVLTVPYGLRRYDGWVVTRAGSDEPLLTT